MRSVEELRSGLQAALGSAVTRLAPVSGGCISPSFRAVFDGGRSLFVKTAPRGAPPHLLEREAFSLRRLAEADTVRVPRIVAEGARWLALEWLEPAAASHAHWQELGRALGRLHRHTAPHYGWDHDNFIGSLAQANGAAATWPAFWAERRLIPQFNQARHHLGADTTALLQRLLEQLEDRLAGADADPASLLHGDLWNGNVHMTVEGPALIDPSSYYGHREVDLAMAALFGGFPETFYEAYHAEWPLLSGAAARRPIYQLYYLLVHVNLFGGSYVASTDRAVREALR